MGNKNLFEYIFTNDQNCRRFEIEKSFGVINKIIWNIQNQRIYNFQTDIYTYHAVSQTHIKCYDDFNFKYHGFQMKIR